MFVRPLVRCNDQHAGRSLGSRLQVMGRSVRQRDKRRSSQVMRVFSGARTTVAAIAYLLTVGACAQADESAAGGAGCPGLPAGGDASNDPSLHASDYVDVDGVRLHYLDWGGEGDVMLFLTGAGNTAHVFDDFAPCFLSDYRVLALTRRGFGESGWPDSGYDRTTLANDILGLLDTLDIERVTLVGHSLAGEEMTRFGGLYPGRTAALVYLDAAYDRVAPFANPSPGIPPPPPGPADSASIDAMHAYLTYLFRVPLPRAEVSAMFTTSPDGKITGRTVGDAARVQIPQNRESPNYRLINSPALAIYKASNDPTRELPWADSTVWAEVRQWQDQHVRPEFARQIADFARIDDSCVIQLQGYHYIFISNRDEVFDLMQRFLGRGEC